MTLKEFKILIRRIERFGYDHETAAEYAAKIGDTPCLDEAENTLVLDYHRQTIIARLPMRRKKD